MDRHKGRLGVAGRAPDKRYKGFGTTRKSARFGLDELKEQAPYLPFEHGRGINLPLLPTFGETLHHKLEVIRVYHGGQRRVSILLGMPWNKYLNLLKRLDGLPSIEMLARIDLEYRIAFSAINANILAGRDPRYGSPAWKAAEAEEVLARRKGPPRRRNFWAGEEVEIIRKIQENYPHVSYAQARRYAVETLETGTTKYLVSRRRNKQAPAPNTQTKGDN